MDAAAPGLLVAQAIGRVATTSTRSCSAGRPASPGRFRSAPQHRPAGYLGYATFQPTFLYELIFDLALAAVLVRLIHHRRIGAPGIFALYVAGYSAFRIFEELLRVDPAHHILGERLNFWVACISHAGGYRMVRVHATRRARARRPRSRGRGRSQQACSAAAKRMAPRPGGTPRAAAFRSRCHPSSVIVRAPRPDRSASALLTVGRRATIRSRIPHESGARQEHPVGRLRPQRPARCQKRLCRRTSTRGGSAIAIITARSRERSIVRATSCPAISG